jgi:hypothetical protein
MEEERQWNHRRRGWREAATDKSDKAMLAATRSLERQEWGLPTASKGSTLISFQRN